MSSATPPRARRVVEVWGDATVDWLIATPPDSASAGLTASYQWETRTPARIVAQAGGAALLHDLLRVTLESTPSGAEAAVEVRGASISRAALEQPGDTA